MEKQNSLIFKSGDPIPFLGSKSYRLTNVAVINGSSLDGFKLNIISYIGEVRSNIPIIFSSLPDIVFLDKERKTASISVKLNFTDKRNIELVLTPPINVTNFEVIIHYETF